MNTFSVQANSPGADQHSREPGSLRVEAPHWTAHITVYNGLFEPVAKLEDLSESPTSSAFEAVTKLPPGIYHVEVSLAGQFEQQIVTVHSNSVTTVPRDTWKRVSFPSSAPFAGSASVRTSHIDPAATLSRRISWRDAPGGESRLFLFVHSVGREPASAFSEGLTLLDETGRVVTEFSTGATRDQSAGWMAFTADLPPGFYVLRRVRRGVPRRYQPIYLLSDWETHVFIEATTYPRLMSMMIGMAPRGAGFDPDDKAVQAAVVVVDALGRSGSGEFATSEKIATLLDRSPVNPWLSIVVAYALLADADRMPHQPPPASHRPARALLDHIKALLQDFDAHPDVRAILLDDSQPAAKPFWHPPLLRLGLGRVRRHATHIASTIPLLSLTDCVLTSLVVNAPWTAWRELERLPEAPPLVEQTVGSGKRQFKAQSTPPPGNAIVGINEIGAAPYGPVAWLASPLGIPDTGPTQILSQVLHTLGRSFAPLVDTPLARSAQALTHGFVEQLPETIPVDFDAMLKALLGSRSPETISSATGLPLARVQRVMDHLHDQAPPAGPGASSQPRQSTARAILSYAIQEVARSSKAMFDSEGTSSNREPEVAATDGFPLTTQSTGLDELIVTIQVEADRLALNIDAPSAKWSQHDLSITQGVIARLDSLTQELLRYAEIVVLTDLSGRVLEGNSAWSELVSTDADRERRRNLMRKGSFTAKKLEQERAWEAVLASFSGHKGTIAAPTPNQVSQKWDIQRSAIEDRPANQVRAFINLLRAPGSAALPAEPDELSSLVNELKLIASLCAYGSAERHSDYVDQLDEVTSQLAHAIGVDTASAERD